MRVLVIENFAGTPLGQVGTALTEAGAEIDLRRAFLGEALPDGHGDYDALVILGGGQNALDDEGSPGCPRSPRLSRAFGEADKAVLGICLGAQLVARGYGGREHPRPAGRVRLARGAADRRRPRRSGARRRSATARRSSTGTTTPSPCRRARSISPTSAMTEIQAFRIGRAVYGIQFHFEADRRLVEDWSARLRRR